MYDCYSGLGFKGGAVTDRSQHVKQDDRPPASAARNLGDVPQDLF